jgi:two-component system LytT family response regulator
MTTCIIVDDEQHAIDVLEHYVKQIPSLHLLASFANPLQALELLNREKVDLLFLDIQMPDISGLDFVRAIQGRSKVILTTAYSEFVMEGFELEVEDYLLKPIPFPRFLKAVQRILQAGSDAPVPEPGVDDYFFVKTELKGKMLRVNFSDIDYFESMNNYVAIHHNGIKTLALLTMKDLENRLPPARFMRIHRSFIIPVDKITAIEGNMVMLRNVREGILLGETYRPAFLEKMRGKMLQ